MSTSPYPAAGATPVTPARTLDLARDRGCRVLPGDHGSWVDGGEARIARIVEEARDRSSTSDELAAHRGDWIERYHLSPERANVVRCLDIPAHAAVLEIGAGCGAVTRYLGEVAATVDALEPTPDRAAVARARTADLPSVEVFVGELTALPAEPAYDLIVMVGVLEYVGGSAGAAPRVAFLREAVARLRPGGTVVCAIENQLGVKYLAGAPEDHVGRPFEGLEGYPRRGPCRTFPRRELEGIFRAAGLAPDVLHAFPDYKLPRLVYSDALLEGEAAPLAWRAARFPSPDNPVPRARLAHEGMLWRSLVRAGLGGEFANSFVVVGRSGNRSPWPEAQRAVFWSTGRRARFATVARLLADGDGRVERRPLDPDAHGDGEGDGGLRHRCLDDPFLTGDALTEILEAEDDAALDRWLRRWREHAEATAPDADGAPDIDVGPENVIVRPDGTLASIDQEWWHAGYSSDDVLDRSLLRLAFTLAEARAPERWPDGCVTVRDVVDELYRRAGAGTPGDDRVAAVVRREAELQAQIGHGDTADDHAALMVTYLERPLTETGLGRRDVDGLAELTARLEAVEAARRASDAALADAEEQLHAGNRELYALKDRYDEVYAAHQAVIGSKAWKLVATARRIAGRVRR